MRKSVYMKHKKTIPRDALIEDVRKARRAPWKACGGTLEGLGKYLMDSQAKDPRGTVSLRRRKTG